MKTLPAAGEFFFAAGYDGNSKNGNPGVDREKLLQICGHFGRVDSPGCGHDRSRHALDGRWGATSDEIAASFTGDELIPSPRITYTRAVSINATPEQIYPWIVQLGAEKGGMYSYEGFETNILLCELINADRIHEEWQNLKVGDPMKMCPGTLGPPPYEIAIIKPNHAIVMGHRDNGTWVEVWQFILVPQEDGTTRLVIRSRNSAEGLLWDVIRPGEFIMMRGMMLGIKERAEGMAQGR